jgi:hypothetical protein
MWCGREVTRARYIGSRAYPSMQIDLDCCYGWTVCLQYTSTIQVMRNDMYLWIDIWTEVNTIEVLVVNSDDRLLEYINQDVFYFEADTRL